MIDRAMLTTPVGQCEQRKLQALAGSIRITGGMGNIQRSFDLLPPSQHDSGAGSHLVSDHCNNRNT